MFSEFHPTTTGTQMPDGWGVTVFMTLGFCPNAMDRFLQSNKQEVLFVN